MRTKSIVAVVLVLSLILTLSEAGNYYARQGGKKASPPQRGRELDLETDGLKDEQLDEKREGMKVFTVKVNLVSLCFLFLFFLFDSHGVTATSLFIKHDKQLYKECHTIELNT